MKLDENDRKILMLIQENARMTAKEIARKINSPITTVFAKIKRMEKEGIIKGYTAILDSKKLGKPVTAFIFASFSKSENVSQKQLVKEIAKMPEVQEVHIITGDWDILIKVKEKDVESIGSFVVDNLRAFKGIDKTLTVLALESEKESTKILTLLPEDLKINY